MTQLPDINLDDPYELEDFISKYKTIKGRRLAHMLGMTGPGSVRLATDLSNYAWNKLTAMDLRRQGRLILARQYEEICDRIYTKIPQKHRPW